MAFESLTERLNGVFKKLRGKGKLSEADISVRAYKAAALKNCLRITVTTMEVVKKVAEVFKKEAEYAQGGN